MICAALAKILRGAFSHIQSMVLMLLAGVSIGAMLGLWLGLGLPYVLLFSTAGVVFIFSAAFAALWLFEWLVNVLQQRVDHR